MSESGKRTQIRDAARTARAAVLKAERYEFLSDALEYLKAYGSLSNISVRFEASAVTHHDKAVTEVEGQLSDFWKGKDSAGTPLRTIIQARIKDEMDAIEKELLE